MNRLEAKFQELRRRKQKAFIAFITAGFPNLKTTGELVLAFARAGVDIVELGVPFSDPMADGPLIQAASQAALKKKTDLRRILALVKEVRAKSQIPICLMTYYNPVFCFGEESFVRAARRAGVDGVILPDLPPEESGPLRRLAARNGLDVICFIAPTTPPERMRYICRIARGFIYYVSLTGVTGPRARLPADLAANLRRIKRYTSKPVCVGFGVSTRSQVKAVQRISDGVIVGSAIVKKIGEYAGRKDLVSRLARFAASLKG